MPRFSGVHTRDPVTDVGDQLRPLWLRRRRPVTTRQDKADASARVARFRRRRTGERLIHVGRIHGRLGEKRPGWQARLAPYEQRPRRLGERCSHLVERRAFVCRLQAQRYGDEGVGAVVAFADVWGVVGIGPAGTSLGLAASGPALVVGAELRRLKIAQVDRGARPSRCAAAGPCAAHAVRDASPEHWR